MKVKAKNVLKYFKKGCIVQPEAEKCSSLIDRTTLGNHLHNTSLATTCCSAAIFVM